MISAKIIADSKNTMGQRITTFILVFPRIVLAEFNTHRALSRNSASSRAIPFKKMVEMVQENPFIPIKWMKDHSGMQGNEFFEENVLTGNDPRIGFEHTWLKARDAAVSHAKQLNQEGNGVSKQIANRPLEPFMWHTVICTGTEWENFFALRAHPAAEIHIQELAHKMLEAYNESTPKQLKEGDWHIPFGDSFDQNRLSSLVEAEMKKAGGYSNIGIREVLNLIKVKIATARCARVSYMNFDGKDDYDSDIALHDRLAQSGHWSPFEHCARGMNVREYSGNKVHTMVDGRETDTLGILGNFKGFIQYRKMFRGENKEDNRVLKS